MSGATLHDFQLLSIGCFANIPSRGGGAFETEPTLWYALERTVSPLTEGDR